MRGHDACNAGRDRRAKWLQVQLFDLIGRCIDNGRIEIRVDRCAPCAGKTFCAGEHAFCLTRFDPRLDEWRDASCVAAHCARAQNRIAGEEIEVADRRKIPVHAHRTCFACSETRRATE